MNYLAIWPDGETTVFGAKTVMELFDTLDTHGNVDTCVILPIKPGSHIGISPDYDHQTNKPTGKMSLAVGEVDSASDAQPKVFRYSVRAGKKHDPAKKCLVELSREEIHKFFEDNSDNWVSEIWTDEEV